MILSCAFFFNLDSFKVLYVYLFYLNQNNFKNFNTNTHNEIRKHYSNFSLSILVIEEFSVQFIYSKMIHPILTTNCKQFSIYIQQNILAPLCQF